MSHKTSSDAHHLLFQDYKFSLENIKFLEQIAFLYYSGTGQSRRVTDTIRETLRNFTSYPGFHSQYALHVAKSDESEHGWHQVHEHVSFLGQAGLTYATLELSNGPSGQSFDKKAKLLPLVNTIVALENLLMPENASTEQGFIEWALMGAVEGAAPNTFQLATFLYEVRRILMDTPANFKGRVWKDKAGKVHLFLTQHVEPEFVDERLNVHLTIQTPAAFNVAVFEQAALSRQAA